jgi:molecular chaperone HscA
MDLLEIFDPKAAPRAVGIDLGTTNSLVAYVKNERPTAIADCDGDRALVLPVGDQRVGGP